MSYPWRLCPGVFAQNLVQPRGSDSTFDLVTWNVHEFYSDFRRLDTLAILVSNLDVDMVAFQEIADTIAFAGLLQRLPGWNGLFAPYDYPGYPYMKTAVIWRTDRASVTYQGQLFVGNQFQFPRPPLHVTATANLGSGVFDFHLIVLHLKAGGTDDDRLRRQAGILMLKAYLDNNIPGDPEQDWIVVGDYNDILDDVQGLNVFWPLLTDSTDYRFLTLPMAGNPYWASFPSDDPNYNSLIDHLLISTYANDEYGGGNTITLRLDDEYSNYANRISDHRPVMGQFLGRYTPVYSDTGLPSAHKLLDVYPNPFNASATISFALDEAGRVKLSVYNILGRKVATLYEGKLETGDHRVIWEAQGFPSGVYFARLETSGRPVTARMLLVK